MTELISPAQPGRDFHPVQMKKNDLEGFAAISREIGHIANIAEGIELTAINGMLMGKKSAGATNGFGIAAHEIQALSLYFIEATQGLSRLVYQMSFLVANGMNLDHRLRILNAAARGGLWRCHGEQAAAGTIAVTFNRT